MRLAHAALHMPTNTVKLSVMSDGSWSHCPTQARVMSDGSWSHHLAHADEQKKGLEVVRLAHTALHMPIHIGKINERWQLVTLPCTC